MDFRTDPLWKNIEQYNFDAPGVSLPFSSRLAAEQNWSASFTQKAILEYKRFIYLCCISPTGASPSPVVDEVWHLHLTYTVDYWQHFCKETLHQDIHHHPSTGGAEEKTKHANWYSNTVVTYGTVFLESPPIEIWPPANDKNTQATQPQISENAPFKNGVKAKYFLLLTPFILSALFFGEPVPFALSGPHFLFFYIVLGCCGYAVAVISNNDKDRQLATMLRSDYNDLNKHELAWLTGGAKRSVLLMISELIGNDILVLLPGSNYIIVRENFFKVENPIKQALLQYPKGQIAFNDLVTLGLNCTKVYTIKFSKLKASFNKPGELFILLVIMAVGILRIFQGLANGEPIGYLVGLIIVFAIFFYSIETTINFHRTCSIIMNKEPMFAKRLTNDLDRGIIFFGMPSIAGIALYSHLQPIFTETNGTGNNSSSSSCGSGCGGDGGGGGSSCGSGCGGCGGH